MIRHGRHIMARARQPPDGQSADIAGGAGDRDFAGTRSQAVFRECLDCLHGGKTGSARRHPHATYTRQAAAPASQPGLGHARRSRPSGSRRRESRYGAPGPRGDNEDRPTPARYLPDRCWGICGYVCTRLPIQRLSGHPFGDEGLPRLTGVLRVASRRWLCAGIGSPRCPPERPYSTPARTS